jgi:hypothetical protein
MHTGSIDGMSAIIGLMPDRRTGVYVLANLDHAELRHALMYKVFDLYAGNPERDWSGELRRLFARPPSAVASGAPQPAAAPAPAPPSLALDRYAATYVDSAYGVVDVTLAGGALSARFRGKDLGPLEHLRADTFRSRAGNESMSLSFVTDGAGNVIAVRSFGITFDRVRTR